MCIFHAFFYLFLFGSFLGPIFLSLAISYLFLTISLSLSLSLSLAHTYTHTLLPFLVWKLFRSEDPFYGPIFLSLALSLSLSHYFSLSLTHTFPLSHSVVINDLGNLEHISRLLLPFLVRKLLGAKVPSM